MSLAPSTDNYTLGKGVCYFNKKDPISGLYLGERDLGNAPSLSLSIDLTKLDHYSSRGGLRAKDKQIVSEITPTLKFTLDEPNVENVTLLMLGTASGVSQAAATEGIEKTVVAYPGTRVKLDYRNIGCRRLVHGAVTGGPFEVGEIITGGTSAATAKVIRVNSGSLDVEDETGTFTVAETITGGTSAATAAVTTATAFLSGSVVLSNVAETTWYVEGTDYTIDSALKDDQIGRVSFPATSTIVAGTSVVVHYAYGAATYTQIVAIAESTIEGSFRFVSDNPAGEQKELEIWRVSLTPDGEVAMISDEWSTIGFTGEILKDEAGHSSSPYFNVMMNYAET